MSETAYGLGAGIFFIGYFLFEVPSNLILHRIGARVWIARIMITWGALSAATMFVTSVGAFYGVRFLLGIAEAGFFPGIILYLTQWYPASRRARILALFMTAVAISGVIGGPVSGWILTSMAGVNGWAGWQWLFLLEGLPSLMMGVAVYFYLDDSIAHARWLPADERAVLDANLQAEARGEEHASLLATLSNPRRGAAGCALLLHRDGVVRHCILAAAADSDDGRRGCWPYRLAERCAVRCGSDRDGSGGQEFRSARRTPLASGGWRAGRRDRC